MKRTQKSFFFLLTLATTLLASVAIAVLPSQNQREQEKNSCVVADWNGDPTNEDAGFFEGKEVKVPKILNIARSHSSSKVLGESTDSKWIEVDLSEQKIRAWDGNSLFLESPVSTGIPGMDTPTGEFRIWIKLKAVKMEGGIKGERGYYYLPNVPYVMFFSNDQVPQSKGYSLHGAYWHNDFGKRKSHGCVNLPIPVAEKLYYWVNPVLSEGKNSTKTTNDNPGTKIVIHQ